MNITKFCRVKMFYRLTLDNGEVIEDAMEGEPMEFIFGVGEILPALERELLGMAENEEKHIDLKPEDAYGPWNPNAVIRIPREEFPEERGGIEEGMIFRIRREDGAEMFATVAEVNEEEIALDLNHPLAGETLHFQVRIAEVLSPGA